MVNGQWWKYAMYEMLVLHGVLMKLIIWCCERPSYKWCWLMYSIGCCCWRCCWWKCNWIQVVDCVVIVVEYYVLLSLVVDPLMFAVNHLFLGCTGDKTAVVVALLTMHGWLIVDVDIFFVHCCRYFHSRSCNGN